MKRYPIVTLCGSTRFKDVFLREQKRLTLEGNIVISVGLFGHAGDNEVWESMEEGALSETKQMLDDMHKRKIDLSDEIFVINVGGYIGESTASEIRYALKTGKKVRYLEQPEEQDIQDPVFMEISIDPDTYCVCQLQEGQSIEGNSVFFYARTKEEYSLIIPENRTPTHATRVDRGWRMIKLEGEFPFDTIGVLSRISSLFAREGISILAQSTYKIGRAHV